MSTTHCALLPSPIGFLGTLAKCDLPLLMNYKLQNMNVFTSQHTWDTNSHLLLSQQDQKHSKPLSTLAQKPLTAIAMLNIPSVSAMADRPFIGVCAINSYYVFCL